MQWVLWRTDSEHLTHRDTFTRYLHASVSFFVALTTSLAVKGTQQRAASELANCLMCLQGRVSRLQTRFCTAARTRQVLPPACSQTVCVVNSLQKTNIFLIFATHVGSAMRVAACSHPCQLPRARLKMSALPSHERSNVACASMRIDSFDRIGDAHCHGHLDKDATPGMGNVLVWATDHARSQSCWTNSFTSCLHEGGDEGEGGGVRVTAGRLQTQARRTYPHVCRPGSQQPWLSAQPTGTHWRA